MTVIGVQLGGVDVEITRTSDGFLTPAEGMREMHAENQRQSKQKLQRIQFADELGYEYAFLSEGHFSLTGVNNPNPLLTQAAAAQRTDSIRLVQIANILPWHDPLRLAEQTATLDILSDGRAEVGVGHGSGSREMETLGQYWGGSSDDDIKNHRTFTEKFKILIQAWTEDTFSFNGEFHDVPPSYTEYRNESERHYLEESVDAHATTEIAEQDVGTDVLQSVSVYPQPIQTPHPQLWRPTVSTHALRWAARHGVNGCCAAGSFDRIETMVDIYHNALEQCEWPDRREAVAGTEFQRGWDSRHDRGIMPQLTVFNTDAATESQVTEFKRAKEYNLQKDGIIGPEGEYGLDVDIDSVISDIDTIVFGSTEEILEELNRFKDCCGYDTIAFNLMLSVPGLSHDVQLAQLESMKEDIEPKL